MIIFERFIVLMWKNLNFQLFCFCYSVVYVRTVFTEAQPGPTLTALYFEIAYSLLRKIPEREFQILTLMNFHEPLEIKCNFQRPSSSDSPLLFKKISSWSCHICKKKDKIFSLKADNYLTLAYYNTYAMHKYWNKNYLFVYQTNPRRFGKIKNPIFVSSQPFSFMNKWQMFLQTTSFWKTFLTHWALILLLPFMNGGNMCIYFGFFWKPWLTTIALVWLFTFMNRFKMLF